jgi:hypothetical protein
MCKLGGRALVRAVLVTVRVAGVVVVAAAATVVSDIPTYGCLDNRRWAIEPEHRYWPAPRDQRFVIGLKSRSSNVASTTRRS